MKRRLNEAILQLLEKIKVLGVCKKTGWVVKNALALKQKNGALWWFAWIKSLTVINRVLGIDLNKFDAISMGVCNI